MTLQPDATPLAEVRARYERAIASLLDKVRQDPYVLGVVLAGSLSHDVVWEKSDIDLMIITQATRLEHGGMTLVEDGISIHATLIPRAEFKRLLEGAIQGSFIHSMLMKGQLLYTRDDTLESLWSAREHFGARDQEIRLIQLAAPLTMFLTKAQKWLCVKHDPLYSCYWILKCLDCLAGIETVLAGEIAGREVVWQALRHNPAFFQAIYTDLLNGPKTHETVGGALTLIENYLKERVPLICRPLLDYLSETDGIRSAREVDHHFHKQMNLEFASILCEWLATEGFIQQVAVPARLTEKSRVDVEEVAYYYDAGR